MIVDRRTIHCKQGRAVDVADLLSEAIAQNTSYTGNYRIYMPDIGPYDVVVIECEYEDVQALRAAQQAWREFTDQTAFWEEWKAVTERGGHGEIWQLASQRTNH